jgi:hypothetical protein
VIAGALAVGAPASAAAPPDVDEIVSGLASTTVYVDPAADQLLPRAEVDELRAQIAASPTPIFIVVVPHSAAEAAGGPEALLSAVAQTAQRRAEGTYVIYTERSFRAGNTGIDLREGQAPQLADAALAANDPTDASALLGDFVRRVAEAAAAAPSRPGSEAGSETGSGTTATPARQEDDGGIGAGPFLLGGGAIVLGAFAWRRSKRKRAEALAQRQAEEADKQMLRAEISVLADDVVRLETEVQLHPDAQSDFDAAVNRYRAAEAALQYADQPLDLIRVERVINEARYSMDRVRARLDGRPLPEPPLDLQRPGRHGEPALTLDDQRQPAYVGYPGGYYDGGWFGGGGGGGLFSGLLLGSMLGGFGGWGHGYGGTTVINNYPGEGDGGGDGGWGGGDFGGGGFGGGDFGGGGFGGGDFGGGDFGGGDFGGGDFQPPARAPVRGLPSSRGGRWSTARRSGATWRHWCRRSVSEPTRLPRCAGSPTTSSRH